MTLAELGLTLEAVIYDADSMAYGILVRGRAHLVLAWRGTTSTSSMQTNLASRSDGDLSRPVEALSDASDVVRIRYSRPTHPSSTSSSANSSRILSFFRACQACCGRVFGGLWRCISVCLPHIPVLRHLLPRVHNQFHEAYKVVRPKILEKVRESMQNSYVPLVITGHSFGGALAVLAARDLATSLDLPDPITVYTFGAPCVGNLALALETNNLVPHHFRVVVDGDSITHPPRPFGPYQHSGRQVLVDADCLGNVIVDPVTIETLGRRPTKASIHCHKLRTYRDCLEACLDDEDQLENGTTSSVHSTTSTTSLPSRGSITSLRRSSGPGGGGGSRNSLKTTSSIREQLRRVPNTNQRTAVIPV
eukprot:CAMPEP_0185784452 /NCGR_PEP_ID=MMETSP1174-20130828/123202_1 /TAXON_ID=35687 /ORGANISM="Dictyocha speculum, Strain CCMP1381" /LENGTH=362 /DNA_ID=CAMNT_0028476037 /DNA_START=3 /DNA_END=1091 /DNA_ORIENTATION=-